MKHTKSFGILKLIVITIILSSLVSSVSAEFAVPAGAAGTSADAGIFAWISQSASNTYIGLDQVYDSIVAVGTFIQTLPSIFSYLVLSLLEVALYPLVDAFNFFYEIVSYMYAAAAPVINMYANAPNWALGWIYNWTPSHAPTLTASAESSLASNSIYQHWLSVSHTESTNYAIISVSLLIFSITINFLLRIVKFVVWIYQKIPIFGGK